MNILVVSYSSIVLELLKMVFKDEDIKSEHVKSIDDAKYDSYDVIFVDDSSITEASQLDAILDNFSYTKLIFIGKLNEEYKDKVDCVVKKPFLPQDIKEILGDIEQDSNREFGSENSRKTKVLNADEIARIKALMELDDEEFEDDMEELSYIDRLENKESFKVKKEEAKEFLIECLGLKKKELKKLLKGAKVSIKVKFEGKDYE